MILKVGQSEWECIKKNQEDGAREGAEFIKNNIIKVPIKLLMTLRLLIVVRLLTEKFRIVEYKNKTK
jgi:hypothetical protein